MSRVVAVLLRLVEEQLSQPLLTLKVCVTCPDELIHGQIFILEHALFHCCYGIRQICRSRYEKPAGRILCSAVLHGPAAFNAALCHHGCENHGVSVHMYALHQVITCSYEAVMMYYLLLEGILELLYIFEFSRISCFKSHKLARCRIYSIMQNELYHLAHVHVACVRRTVRLAASRSRLCTAYDSPVSRFFYRASSALFEADLYCRFITEKSRVRLSLLDHFASEFYQLLRCLFPDSHCHYRLLYLQRICRFQAEI